MRAFSEMDVQDQLHRSQFPNAIAAEDPQPLLREIARGEPYPVHALGPLRMAVEALGRPGGLHLIFIKFFLFLLF